MGSGALVETTLEWRKCSQASDVFMLVPLWVIRGSPAEPPASRSRSSHVTRDTAGWGVHVRKRWTGGGAANRFGFLWPFFSHFFFVAVFFPITSLPSNRHEATCRDCVGLPLLCLYSYIYFSPHQPTIVKTKLIEKMGYLRPPDNYVVCCA